MHNAQRWGGRAVAQGGSDWEGAAPRARAQRPPAAGWVGDRLAGPSRPHLLILVSLLAIRILALPHQRPPLPAPQLVQLPSQRAPA